MANAIFGYENMLFKDGVTLTPSSEAADHDADSLLDPNPTSFWRATTITSPISLAAAFGTSRKIDLVAPLYMNATPTTNVLNESEDLSDAEWAQTGINAVTESTAVSISVPEPVILYLVQDDTSNGEHKLVQSSVSQMANNAGSFAQTAYFSVYAQRNSINRNLRIVLANGSTSSYVDFDTSDGSVIGESAGVGWTLTTSAGEAVSGTVYRLGFKVTPPSAGITTVTLQLLENTSSSYTGAGVFGLFVGAPMLDRVSETLRPWGVTTANSGSFWRAKNQIGQVLSPRPIPLYSTVRKFSNANGWVHSYAEWSAIASTATVYFHDPQNLDGYFDLSNLYIGPSFQPAKNFHYEKNDWPNISKPLTGRAPAGQRYPGEVSPVRRWQLRFGFQVKADAMEFHAMDQLNGASVPVVCILDPDETVYGQEEIMYGTIEEMKIGQRAWFASAQAHLFEVEMILEEMIP